MSDFRWQFLEYTDCWWRQTWE